MAKESTTARILREAQQRKVEEQKKINNMAAEYFESLGKPLAYREISPIPTTHTERLGKVMGSSSWALFSFLQVPERGFWGLGDSEPPQRRAWSNKKLAEGLDTTEEWITREIDELVSIGLLEVKTDENGLRWLEETVYAALKAAKLI